jgi:hypothetical protein
MSSYDLDWIEKWLVQKRGTEHAARPYGKGSLLLTTLIFEVRRERRHRDKAHEPAGLGAVYATNMTADQFEARGGEASHMGHVAAAEAQRIGSGGVCPGEYRTTYTTPSETGQIKRGKRTGVVIGLGLPLAIIAAVVAGLMWWHTGGVLPQ